MSNERYEIIIRDDGVYILQTEEYRFHLDEKTHVEKIGRLINENEQLKQQIKDLYKFIKCDVDNEIDIYPQDILKHLVDILKIIGDVE